MSWERALIPLEKEEPKNVRDVGLLCKVDITMNIRVCWLVKYTSFYGSVTRKLSLNKPAAAKTFFPSTLSKAGSKEPIYRPDELAKVFLLAYIMITAAAAVVGEQRKKLHIFSPNDLQPDVKWFRQN
jgi:hypothetical protein